MLTFRRHPSAHRLAAAAILVLAGSALGQPLDRDPTSYHILARENLGLKNYQLVTPGPGCNIGVNDADGTLTSTSGSAGAASDTQIVADDCSLASGSIDQCFCNRSGFGGICLPFAAPILPSDQDADFIAACNALPGGDFPMACVAGAQNVDANKNADCSPAAVDAVPGNAACDLPAGAYGAVKVDDAAVLNLLGGTYTVESYRAGTNASLMVLAPSTLDVCGNDDLKLGDQGPLVAACDALRVNYAGQGVVNLGVSKQGVITMRLCAPFAHLRMRPIRNQLLLATI